MYKQWYLTLIDSINILIKLEGRIFQKRILFESMYILNNKNGQIVDKDKNMF